MRTTPSRSYWNLTESYTNVAPSTNALKLLSFHHYTTSQSDVSTSICSSSSSSACAAATRSSFRFICHAQLAALAQHSTMGHLKVCLLTYKCLHGLAPDYLTRLCVRVSTVHGRPRLRSSDDHQLLIPRTRTVTLGPCAFNTSGPASWNALPAAIHDPAVVTLGTFRLMLKSFLFWLTDVYRPWYSCCSTWRLLRGVWKACYYYYYDVFGVTMSWIVTADAYCCMPAAAAQNAYLKYGLAWAQRPSQLH